MASLRSLAWVTVVPFIALPAATAADSPPGSSRIAFAVALDKEPSWRDLAFLACLPPANVLDAGRPAVLAVGPEGQLPPHLADFLSRYRPRKIYFLQPDRETALRKPRQLSASLATIKAADLSQATAALALLLRPRSESVVVCDRNDYALALCAAVLAARIKCPLIFSDGARLDDQTHRTLETLKPKKVIWASAHNGCNFELPGAEVEHARNDKHIIRCLLRRGLPVNYLAVANPLDRSVGRVRKLSLVAAILAAGREGAVAALPLEPTFKRTFTGKTPAPANGPGRCDPRSGKIVLDGQPHSFLAYKPSPRLRAYSHVLIDGKGPYTNGQIVTLGNKAYSLTVGGSKGTAAVQLTWPTGREIAGKVKPYYRLARRPPEYLCIVAMPDQIPPAIHAGANNTPDVASDDALGNADEDPFYEVAVARFPAHSVSAASAAAARSLAYPDLVDAPEAEQWKKKYLMAQWNIHDFRWDVERAGFTDIHWHKEGGEASLSQHLRRSSLIFHEAHSMPTGLGGFVNCNLKEMLAPCLVVSAGCSSAAIDTDPRGRSVALQLLQQGAVAYVGSSRPAIWPIGQMIDCFWGNVLKENMTVGKAFLEAQNVKQIILLETKSPLERYQLRAMCLYGDPAWKPYIPRPRPTPSGKARPLEYTLNVPQHGRREAFMPPKRDWGYKKDDPLYNWRADGLFHAPFKRRLKRDRFRDWVYFVCGKVTTTGRVRKLKQLTQPNMPPECELGWSGQYHIDINSDGSSTLRWLVPVFDWDAVEGKIIYRLPPGKYRIEYAEPGERGN
ncbi:MAG: C25 family cysteine peptidase [Planctomycetota bacterium]|jgi:hypothetical protein